MRAASLPKEPTIIIVTKPVDPESDCTATAGTATQPLTKPRH